jgi:hypothetical protein
MASDVRLKEQLPELTGRIVQTYFDVGTINHLGHCPLPNYEAIVSVLEDLKEVIYPGYRRREGLHHGNVLYHVGDLIDGLHDKLTTQIGRALRHDARETVECGEEIDFEALGQAKAIEFLDQLPELRKMLALDVQAAYDGDPACGSLDEVIFCYPGLEAVTVYRLAHLLYDLQIPLIPRMMTEWVHSKTGIDIHPGATIGHHFFIDHGTGGGDRPDVRDRQPRQALPGRDAGRVELRHRRGREPRAGHQASSDAGGPGDHLRQRHGAGGRHGGRARQRDRLQRVAHAQRRAALHRHAGEAQAPHPRRAGRAAIGRQLADLKQMCTSLPRPDWWNCP